MLRIKGKVGPRKSAVGSVRVVEYGNMQRDPLLLDQPGETLGGAVGAVGARQSGFEPNRSSVRSIIVRAAPTSAWRIARVASTSTITPWSVSMR